MRPLFAFFASDCATFPSLRHRKSTIACTVPFWRRNAAKGAGQASSRPASPALQGLLSCLLLFILAFACSCPAHAGRHGRQGGGTSVPDVASVSLSPGTVQQNYYGQTTATATVSLTGAALTGGQVVVLGTGNTAATVQACVRVPAGQTSATFIVNTAPVTDTTTVDISAAYAQNPPHSATLTIQPNPYLFGFDDQPGTGPLSLTPAGIARGFGLSTFASNFPNSGIGPVGIAFAGNGHVYVTNAGTTIYDFPSDADGQDATTTPWVHSAGFSFANSDGNLYMTDEVNEPSSGSIARLTGLAGPGQTAQSNPIVSVPGYFRGMCANPANGHLFVCNEGDFKVYEVDPVAKTATVFLSGFYGLDGISISADGRTLYLVVALSDGSHMAGYDLRTHALTFLSNLINGADGCSVGHGALRGKLYVNTNYGEVYEVDLATAEMTLIAAGGTRGDLTANDPNGSLLLTQTDRIIRLIPPPGGSFTESSLVAATRDDLTNANTLPYTLLSLIAPTTSGSPTRNAAFGFAGLGGVVERAAMQRGGSVAWSGAGHFDMQWGLQSLANGGLSTFAPLQTSVQAGTSPQPYFTFWSLPDAVFGPPATNGNLPSPFYTDIQAGLGQTYHVGLLDQISSGSGSYTISDTPQQNWPNQYARNILSATVYTGANPAIAQSRALDITLPGSDQPQEGQWDIARNGQTVASSLNPQGWNVETDHATFGCAWVTVPGGAATGPFYEVRCTRYGSGYFDVTGSVTPPASAPLLLPLAATPGVIVGGNTGTGTVTLDAPAPTGGATITLTCMTGGVSVPQSVTVPAGQTGASYTLTTQPTTFAYSAVVLASYNGLRQLVVAVVPPGGSPPGGGNGGSLSLTATGLPGRVTLNWTALSTASSYNVRRATTSGGPYTRIATGVTGTQYVDAHVVNGTTYYYVVAGVNVYGEGANSNEAAATPTAPVPLASLTTQPTSVLGGNLAIGTVTLSSPAPSGGAPVSLSASSYSAFVPASVLVPEGQRSVDFVITTAPVASDTPVVLTATSSTTSTATLTVLAPSVLSLTLTPNPVVGGGAVTGTVTLTGDTQGATLTLTSGNPTVATPDATTVSVPYGQRRATFTLTTTSVGSATPVAITVTHSSGCNGAATTNLQVNPANIACYIADLTLSPTCIIGAGTSTATVTLSAPAPAGGAIVTLKSNNANVTVPVSITVPANSQTATFTVTDSGVDDLTFVTISGYYNTWTQAAVLTALPTGYALSVSNLSAKGGNGCVVLNWQDLPEGSVQGYNVYRVVNGTPVLLNTSPITSAMYADTGLINGSTYQYQVRVVNLQGQEISPAVASAVPTASSPTVSLLNIPQTTVTGTLAVNVVLSSGMLDQGKLLIDGKDTGRIVRNDIQPSNSIRYVASVDTTQLANGQHTLQVVDSKDTEACATSVATITTGNNLSAFTNSNMLELSAGNAARIKAALSSGYTNWLIQILDANNNIVRAWTSSSSTIRLAWDGNDNAGQTVPDDTYILQVTGFQNSQSQVLGIPPIRAHHKGLFALALIDYSFDERPEFKKIEDQMYDHLVNLFREQQKRQSTGPWIVWGPRNKDYSDENIETLRKDLTFVKVFYNYSHGIEAHNARAMLAFKHKNITFYPGDVADTPTGPHDINIRKEISETVNFAYLYSCQSGGGKGGYGSEAERKTIGTPDIRWALSFHVVPGWLDDSRGTFWGWASSVSTGPQWVNVNDHSDPDNPHPEGAAEKSNFYWWDYFFWEMLAGPGSEDSVLDAKDRATEITKKHYPNLQDNNNMLPWDYQGGPYRGVFAGDALGTILGAGN